MLMALLAASALAGLGWVFFPPISCIWAGLAQASPLAPGCWLLPTIFLMGMYIEEAAAPLPPRGNGPSMHEAQMVPVPEFPGFSSVNHGMGVGEDAALWKERLSIKEKRLRRLKEKRRHILRSPKSLAAALESARRKKKNRPGIPIKSGGPEFGRYTRDNPLRPQFRPFKFDKRIRKGRAQINAALQLYTLMDAIKAMVLAGYALTDIKPALGLINGIDRIPLGGPNGYFDQYSCERGSLADICKHLAKREKPEAKPLTIDSLIKDGLWGILPHFVRKALMFGPNDLYLLLAPPKAESCQWHWDIFPWWVKVASICETEAGQLNTEDLAEALARITAGSLKNKQEIWGFLKDLARGQLYQFLMSVSYRADEGVLTYTELIEPLRTAAKKSSIRQAQEEKLRQIREIILKKRAIRRLVILFACATNLRSGIFEMLGKDFVRENGLEEQVEVISGGLDEVDYDSNWFDSFDPRSFGASRQAAAEFYHKKLSPDLGEAKRANIIFVATQSHMQRILEKVPGARDKIFLFNDLWPADDWRAGTDCAAIYSGQVKTFLDESLFAFLRERR